jgi:hypothetical protein
MADWVLRGVYAVHRRIRRKWIAKGRTLDVLGECDG